MKSKQLAEILPIVALFLFALYPEEMAMVSHSILGKLVVLAIIVYYTCIDPVYGFLACVMFLFFYQTDLANNALNNVQSGWLIEEGLENLVQELGTDISALESGYAVSNYVYAPAPDDLDETYPIENNLVKAVFDENIWMGYNKYDATSFSYTPVISPNAENERILNASTERDLIRATFPSPGTFSQSPATCSPDDDMCDIWLKTDIEQLMVFPKDSNEEGFVDQMNTIWGNIMGGVSDFVHGHNSTMWKTYITA